MLELEFGCCWAPKTPVDEADDGATGDGETTTTAGNDGAIAPAPGAPVAWGR